MKLEEIKSPHPLECIRYYNATTTWNENVYSLPDVSFGLRTQTDVRIIKKMLAENIGVYILTPFASRIQKIEGMLSNIISDKGVANKPLIIPDIEPEAFSFNCIARHEYKRMQPPSIVQYLLNTSLSGTSGIKYYTAWRNVQNNLRPFYNFTAEAQRRLNSQIYFAPTSLIRGDSNTVKLAFDVARELLLQGLKFDPRSPAFPEWGISFLFHSDFFGNDIKNDSARQEFLNELSKILRMDSLPEHLSISIKLSDDKLYSSNDTEAASRRMTFSNLIGEVFLILEEIRNGRSNGVGGSLIFQNAHPGLLLGFFDSGFNVCSVRMSGNPVIDMPITRGKKGERKVTAMWDHEKLTDQPLEFVKKTFIDKKAFTVPKGIDPTNFWDLPSRQQYDYYSEIRAKSCIEQTNELKKALVNPEPSYKDELRDRVNNAAESQILLDLCPTLKMP